MRPMPPTCNWEPRAHHHLPKSYPKWRKIHPRSFNSFGNTSKSYPKSIPKASWTPASTNTLYKLDVEHSKKLCQKCPRASTRGTQNGPEVLQSAQKRPQTGPNPPQMEPKTLPRSLCGVVFWHLCSQAPFAAISWPMLRPFWDLCWSP